MKYPKFLIIFLVLLMIPMVNAQEECGLRNLPSCIVDKFYQYTVELLSGAFDPLIGLVTDFISEPVNVSVFSGLWGMILYVISLFYGIVFLYAGLMFIVSGDSTEKRVRSKKLLERAVLMIVFLQGSYFIYELVIELSASLTTGMMSLIDPSFFSLTTDSFATFGLQISYYGAFLSMLFLVALLLGIRYLIVSVGVVFFAIGIFCYFFGPLEKYGKLIINFLAVNIFLPVFAAIILLAASVLTTAPVFSNLKIFVMIAAYALICLLFFYFMLFTIIKSVVGMVLKVAVAVKLPALAAASGLLKGGK